LQELYQRTVGQWRTEMSHVAVVVGGVLTQEKFVGQPGPRFTPQSRQKQKDAVKFINDNVFKTPTFLNDLSIVRRVEAQGAITRITGAQTGVLNALLEPGRMNRLVELEATATQPGTTYPLTEMLDDVRGGVWTELTTPVPKIDAYRRSLQRAYLETVKQRLNPPAAPADSAGGGRGGGRGGRGGGGGLGDARGALRGQLRTLDAQLKVALGKATDRATRLHIEDARTEISDILKGKTGGAADEGSDPGNGGIIKW